MKLRRMSKENGAEGGQLRSEGYCGPVTTISTFSALIIASSYHVCSYLDSFGAVVAFGCQLLVFCPALFRVR